MRRALLFGLLWTVACGEPLLVGAPEDAGASEAPEPEPAPEPAPRAEPAPEPSGPAAPAPPPPDPEAEARARAEAARAAFEARFPNHGVTYHFLARVRGRPHHEGPIVGYMRRGSRFRASERVPGVGCARGWFEVPGGGFVCRGEGFKIGAEPQTFEPAPQPPALEGALPYSYAYAARDDVAQFWRLPSEAEESEVAEAFAQLRRAAEAEAEALSPNPDAGVPAPPASDDESEGAPSDEATADEAADEATEDDAPEAAASAAEAEAPPPPGTEGNEGEESAPADAAPDPSLVAAARGELTVPDYVRLRMRRGFYVSLDGEERDGGRAFYRTVRGAYVRSDTLIPSEPPTHRGVVLGGPWQLPVGFVFRGGTHRLRRVAATNRLRDVGRFERQTPLVVADRLMRGSREYLVTRDGDVVRRSSVRLAEPEPRPEEIGEDERWVHIDLGEQMLVAYEGDQPVFATLVSTGREGYETPVGVYRIRSKHVSTTMDDLNAGDESYLIEDVPWTMYFEGNYALHAAFWHHGFGRVRSHGCVNLAPADARWIFQWTGPTLPASWHGVFSDGERPGTWIVVTE